jgi:adenosine deaminase
MSILKSENHLHLYGCLPAESLFKESFDRAKKYSSRFQWFLSEYKKTTGIEIHPESWWNKSDGYVIFKRHFICEAVNRFEVFQSKFNLLIALFPTTPDDLKLAEIVFATQSAQGGYKEYRTFLPHYLPVHERALYLRNLIDCARSFESSTYHPRIAISFSRQDGEAWDSYQFLLEFLANHQDIIPWITGIDFCGNERGHPPSAKKNLFSKIMSDRKAGVHNLDVLYHVGEMWDDIALHSAARWCIEAADMDVRRLGHALALGMDPESLKGRKIYEPLKETNSHLNWLRLRQNELSEYGYTTKDQEWLLQYIEFNSHQDMVTWHYDDELIWQTRNFQNAALNIIKSKNPVIEICPTSNIRIGALGKPSFHPLKRFLDHGLNITISTDDPGIFDISLEEEEQLVKSHFAVSEEQLTQAEKLSASLFLPLAN